MFPLTQKTLRVVLLNMGTKYSGIALQAFGAWSTEFPLLKMGLSTPQKCLLMKSPIFFSKGRTVRFWIQIVLVLALVRIALLPSALYANPTGEQVVGGAAGFNRPDAATLIVNQNTDRAVINWNSFSIANGELTKFVQPSSSSAVLNRVVTANPSAIYGTLQANGNVYLINPGGVLVGAGGVVNTASFVASTHDISTEEFMKGGQLNFKGNSDASVVNQGNITAREGDVFLIAKEVKNEGQLMAKDGTVGMVSGTEVSLQAVGQGNYKVRLLAAETDPTSPRTSQGEGGASKGSAEIVNEGVIQAANAVLEAKGSYLPMAIRNTGVIEATGLVENGDGSVTLTGGEGDILNTGVVAALQRSLDGQKETGGSILMAGKNVSSDPGSIITAAGRDGGGTVKLRAGDTTILRGEISVVGGAESAKGGQVQLLGERVGLFDQAKVDASGGAGGGEVLVGGDYLGRNPDVPNAKITVTAPNSRIFADAAQQGDGGKVILWSDEYTGSHGNIYARGGAVGGNGGFVETSSKNELGVFGFVHVGAPAGIGGLWLLDPKSIVISGTVTSPFNYTTAITSPPFSPGTAPYEITFTSSLGLDVTVAPDIITYGLSQGSVILQATDSILVSSAIPAEFSTDSTDTPASTTVTTVGGYTLFLQSGGKITIDASIDINSSINLSSSFNSLEANPTVTTGLAGDIVINGQLNSRLGTVTITANRPTQSNQTAGSITINSSVASAQSTVTILAEAGNITLGANLAATTVNLITGVDGATDGGFINQEGGVIQATNLNAMTQSSVLPLSTVPGGHGLPWQLSSYIYLGSANEVVNVSLVALGGAAAAGQNSATSFNPALARPTEAATLIYYKDTNDFYIGTTTASTLDVPLVGAARGIITAGSVNLVAGAGGTGGVTQTQPIYATALGIEAVGDVTLPLSDTGLFAGGAATGIGNDVLFLSGDTRATPTNGSFTFADRNGFNVSYAQTYWGPAWPGENTLLFGIRAGDVILSALDGTEASGITLLNETPFIITSGNQYSLLSELPISFTTRSARPGHIEASGDVSITVGDPDTAAGDLDTRFTLDEGIHLFAGMNNGLSAFSGPTEGADDTADGRGRGIVALTANNMTIGSDTLPQLTMHGLIMTGNINQSSIIDETSGVFLRPYGDGGVTAVAPLTGAPTPNYDRPIYIVSPKADYDITPDPGQLQLTMAELQRINTSRLGLYSAFTDAGTGPGGAVLPAVEVRTALTLNGLYDVTKTSGVFPNYAGANRLELWAFGGADSNVQISADISTDTGSGGNNAALQVWLASANALNTAAGTVNVNAGLRSYGGSIALQGDSVNINGLINANSTQATEGLGLVAILPGSTNRDMNLGTKQVDALGVLRNEIALITAGTVQFGISSLSPEVLQPMSPLTNTYLVGSNPLWTDGNMETLAGVNSGTMLISDLITDLSIDTLALLADNSDGQGFDGDQQATAMKQNNNNAGIRVPGLFIGGAPGTVTVAAPGTDYILNSSLNQIDRLGVALTTTGNSQVAGQDDAGAGTPTGDLYLVNSKGLVGGNSGEVARRTQQWDQGLVLATVADAPLYTGIGLVAARALAIVAAGPVAIYETLPAGVAGLGQYMAHVSANPNNAAQRDQVEVGNQIGVIGGSGTTVGLAIDARQNNPGESGANTAWAASARGLAISDLSAGVFPISLVPVVSTVSGILTNGGLVTLEGNAIEIINAVVRPGGGGTITVDTTGDGIAPAGAQVTIRPATGRNGFQDRLGSGAYDPLLENSILAGAPVEMNLGTGSTQGFSTVNLTSGTGSGASVTFTTDATGAITGYTILSGGAGYGATTATVTSLLPTASGAVPGAVTVTGGVITAIAIGTAGTGYNTGFLNSSLDTVWIGAPSLSATAIRASAIEIGQNSIPGTAAGKITVSDALAFNLLTQSLNLSSGGAVEAADNLDPLGNDTITLAGGLAVQSIGAVALRGDVDEFAVDTSGGTQGVRFIDSDEITIGNVDGVSGILGGSVFLEAGGNIAQSDGATIQATALGLRATGVGASIRLDQSNDVSLVAATALKTIITITDVGGGSGGSALATVNPITGAISSIEILNGGQGYTGTTAAIINGPVGSGATAGAITINAGVITGIAVGTAGTGYLTPGDVYLKTGSNLSVSQVAAGAPGGTPAAVAGISGANVTLVTGGNITQDGNAPVAATGAFLATVAEGSSVSLDSSSNSFAQAPLVAALTSTGALGSASDVTIVNNGAGGILLGQAGVVNIELLTTGSGYTAAPTINFSSGTANASPILGVGTITLSNNGSGYLSAPSVSITGGGGVGATAEAVVDLNALSSSYGQITRINITNTGTGYTTLPTVTLTGGSPAQAATVTSGTAATLLLQRINLIDPGIGSNYTTTPTVTISGSGGSGATATATIGGTGGYVASSASTVTGGITGNLVAINSGSGTFSDGNGFSVEGTSTFGSLGTITLDSTLNNMLGTITAGSNGSVTINNANSSIVGNFTGANSSGVPDSTVALGGSLTLGSKGSIYQASSGALLKVAGAASFYATATALTGGTPNGAVILNNANNAFASSISAEGTRVVIRDSTALILGNIIATTSLTATTTAALGDITQDVGTTIGNSTYTTGPAAFAAANGQSITVGNVGNYFGSTVSFAALSGTLANVSVLDTTALDLGALTLGAGGNLNVTAAGITQSGALVVPGTITLAGAANNITLSNTANNFGTVVITSGNNVTLRDSGGVILSGPSFISGNFSLTAGGNITDALGTALDITGLATFDAGTFNVTLGDNPGDTTNFGSLNLTGGTVTVTEDSAMVLAGATATTLDLTAASGITQTGAVQVAANSTFTANAGQSILLGNSGNNFTGTVTFNAAGVGNLDSVTLYDQSALTTQAAGLALNGALTLTSLAGITLNSISAPSLSATAGGNITDVNGTTLNIAGLATFNAGGFNITLGDNPGDTTNFGSLNLNGATVTVTEDSAMVLAAVNATSLDLTSSGVGGGITQTGSMIVTGASGFTSNTGTSVILGNTANQFTGQVTFTGTGGNLTDVTLNNQSAYSVQSGGLNLSGNLAVTANGISQAGAITISGTTGTTTLDGGTGAIALINSGNTYASTVTVLGGASADMFFRLADEADLGAVTTSGTFTLRTADDVSFNIANDASAGFDVTDTQLSSFNIGIFAPIASGALGNLNLGALTSYPGIGSISLTTEGGGSINGSGAISMNTLQFNSSGAATFSAVNQIQNLGNVTVASGGLTFRNGRGLNLTGTVSMPQRFSLEVAGQFYNQTGSATPLAAVQGGSVVKSLSLMGGLPNQISGLAGFSYRYDGQMPTSGNVMSYAVSPLTMFAPGGTTIAGVDLGGTQTGGGQFNTFLTGSDNLNWMISDFGRFDMPTVKPSGMDYILYPQRVEPETKTLPAATLGQLERELGRPPTLEEIQSREVVVREAAMVRSGAILERNSFDAVEEEVDKQESAEAPAQVIDGGKPQADARGQRSEDGMQKAEVGSRPSFAPSPASAGGASQGFGSQARKTQSVRQGSNGPILRSGPIRSVAQLRPAEPSQSGNISEASAQALKLDAKSVIEQERASAEVGIAPPIAAGR